MEALFVRDAKKALEPSGAGSPSAFAGDIEYIMALEVALAIRLERPVEWISRVAVVERHRVSIKKFREAYLKVALRVAENRPPSNPVERQVIGVADQAMIDAAGEVIARALEQLDG